MFGPDIEITREFTVGGNPFELAEQTPEVAVMGNTVGPDGELYVFWEDFGTSRMVGRRSDDEGVTFGPEFTVGPSGGSS